MTEQIPVPLLLRRLKYFDIMKNGLVYLRRFFLRNRRDGISVFLHNIRRPDDDRDPHDHPRSFLTIVLSGGYTDESWDGDGDWAGSTRFRGPRTRLRRGSIRFRRAEHVHRVRDVLPNTWTLTIWGPYRREWGFWDAAWNFIPWRTYLGITGDYDGD